MDTTIAVKPQHNKASFPWRSVFDTEYGRCPRRAGAAVAVLAAAATTAGGASCGVCCPSTAEFDPVGVGDLRRERLLSVSMDADESSSAAAAPAMAARPLHHPSTIHQGLDRHDNDAGNNDENARDFDRRELWKETLRQSCLERARNAKRGRLLAATGGAAATSEEGAATPTSVSPDLASPMNGASLFFGRNHDQPPIPESASALKRRRFAYDSIDRVLLAQRTIQEELIEHGSGSGRSWLIPSGSFDATPDGRSPLQRMRSDGTDEQHPQQQQSAASASASSPANSNRSNDEFVMTNEEWLDLLRQVQDELDIDWDGMDGNGCGANDSEGWSEAEDERLLEQARAEQAHWDGMAEEWMAREVEPDLSDDPSGKQSAWPASAGQVTTTSQLEQVVEEDARFATADVVCPVCQEARLSLVTNECEAAEANDALNATNGGVSGSIVCPNHMDGSCSMRIDNVPLLRSGTSRLGQDGDPTSSVVGQHAMETLRRRLGHLSYEVGGSTCTHPLAFEVTDQVLHARCAYCGGSKSVLLASWFPSHRRGCSS
jgi:hypothetical protein